MQKYLKVIVQEKQYNINQRNGAYHENSQASWLFWVKDDKQLKTKRENIGIDFLLCY